VTASLPVSKLVDLSPMLAALASVQSKVIAKLDALPARIKRTWWSAVSLKISLWPGGFHSRH